MLVHYSAKPVVLGDLSNREQEEPNPFGKPRGLWVSSEGNGDGWKEWCVSERFGLENLKIVQQVHLRSDARILWITDEDQLDAFDEMYSQAICLGGIRLGIDLRGIDWKEVALTYQGIVITPYLWARRLTEKCRWYYGWDCASGCIWDIQAIERIDGGEPVVLPQVEQSEI